MYTSNHELSKLL